MQNTKICFIGAGNMSRAIIGGLIKSGYSASLITATNPSTPKLDALATDYGINTSQDNVKSAAAADVIVLSVKPQLMQAVCESLTDVVDGKLLITIAAGIPESRYHDYFGRQVKLIRTMPNTPMQLGLGMTGLYAPAGMPQEDKAFAESLMRACGDIVWVDKESGIDKVIALAGSSPAYFFLFIEAMIEAGVEMGLPEADARTLAQQAAVGAAAMVKQNPELTPAELRANVTSKGGTTAEAIATFEAGGLRSLVKDAMGNCIKRAEEMARNF
ncbi:pyrroline-5-carboxylate reductase [Shewanella litorisediminis]|uniref:Pyrroline-5-carboxylate reductase n=1 Tax=Shewanella litorisediminis TaxID=1173586 RepID=A0ABX7G0F7_9GAMM|nr:pyrroline-5-carboxylate reductase [Shewanella litorisediminis]MCL2918182.1 pyrroline-5-carboxylate reductase [Shewanella litorisediminis]QRH00763.1 pyrroline-5-carboxylate reductase [Shewanella litorisediminis]